MCVRESSREGATLGTVHFWRAALRGLHSEGCTQLRQEVQVMILIRVVIHGNFSVSPGSAGHDSNFQGSVSPTTRGQSSLSVEA